jgi:hypothetical protein
LLEIGVSIIKGNASEIAFLAGQKVEIKGVEAIGTIQHPEKLVKELALKTGQHRFEFFFFLLLIFVVLFCLFFSRFCCGDDWSSGLCE